MSAGDIQNTLKMIAGAKQALNAGDVKADEQGNTWLHKLAPFNSPEAVALMEAFIKKGTPIDIQNNEGNTPLHLVAQAGNFSAADLLIMQNADINIENKVRKKALAIAERLDYASLKGRKTYHILLEASKERVCGKEKYCLIKLINECIVSEKKTFAYRASSLPVLGSVVRIFSNQYQKVKKIEDFKRQVIAKNGVYGPLNIGSGDKKYCVIKDLIVLSNWFGMEFYIKNDILMNALKQYIAEKEKTWSYTLSMIPLLGSLFKKLWKPYQTLMLARQYQHALEEGIVFKESDNFLSGEKVTIKDEDGEILFTAPGLICDTYNASQLGQALSEVKQKVSRAAFDQHNLNVALIKASTKPKSMKEIAWLIDQGADATYTEEGGDKTALYQAIWSSSLDVVELLAKNTDPHLKYKYLKNRKEYEDTVVGLLKIDFTDHSEYACEIYHILTEANPAFSDKEFEALIREREVREQATREQEAKEAQKQVELDKDPLRRLWNIIYKGNRDLEQDKKEITDLLAQNKLNINDALIHGFNGDDSLLYGAIYYLPTIFYNAEYGKKYVELIQFLLKLGADPDHKLSGKESPHEFLESKIQYQRDMKEQYPDPEKGRYNPIIEGLYLQVKKEFDKRPAPGTTAYTPLKSGLESSEANVKLGNAVDSDINSVSTLSGRPSPSNS